MEIPLRNIYYILSYAWKYFKFNDLTKLDKKDFNSPTEFLQKFLIYTWVDMSKKVKKTM